MATAVEVRDLKAWFGKTEALHGINMAVESNHATAVIGPSGCGKSTFIRCLNRMHETNPVARAEGEVKVGDMDIYSMPAVDVRRKVGMVIQKPNPFTSMSIYDNVAAGLKLNGTRNHKMLDDVVERSLQQAALWDEVKDALKKKSGASLSGGQQQRLCIARAIAVNPEVILMDEPCSALDPIATARIEELIDELRQNFCIIIVTHSMQQAARVSQRTAFFHLGKLVEEGATAEIFTNPKEKR